MTEEIAEEIKELVIARLQSMPENLRVSLGGMVGMDKHEIIDHVKKGDEIGSKIIEIQMHFIQSLKKAEYLRAGSA